MHAKSMQMGYFIRRYCHYSIATQMKISWNENLFPSFTQRYNRSNDCSFP